MGQNSPSRYLNSELEHLKEQFEKLRAEAVSINFAALERKVFEKQIAKYEDSKSEWE